MQTTGKQDEGRPPDGTLSYAYTGETAMAIYTQSKQHLANYKSHLASQKAVESWMWEDTASHHGGVVGLDQEQGDYENLGGVPKKPASPG